MSPPFAHETNVPVDSPTDIHAPIFGSRPVFVHAAPGAWLNVPIAVAPNDGPGYEVTPDGVHTWVTGLTVNAVAEHEAAQTSNRFNDTDVIDAPL